MVVATFLFGSPFFITFLSHFRYLHSARFTLLRYFLWEKRSAFRDKGLIVVWVKHKPRASGSFDYVAHCLLHLKILLYVPPSLFLASCLTTGASIPDGAGLAFIVAGVRQEAQSCLEGGEEYTFPGWTGFPVPSHNGHSTLTVPSPRRPVPLQFSQISLEGVLGAFSTTVPAVASIIPSPLLFVQAYEY